MKDRPIREMVSVIIPTFNYAHFLPETLDSVFNQTYTDWECIVVDDGSTDNTREVVTEYLTLDPRFKYIFQKNKGLPGARNTGVKAARGDYFQFLDADDLLEPCKLAEQSSFLSTHPDVDIVYGEVRFFSTEHPEQRLLSIWEDNLPWMPKISGNGRPILLELLKKNFMVVNAPLLRRSVFCDCAYFDETLKNYEDWDYWLRCAQRGKTFWFMDAPGTLALVRYHEQSMSRSHIAMSETLLRLRKRLQQVLKDPEFKKINRADKEKVGFDLSVEYLKNGQIVSGAFLFLNYFWRPYGRRRLLHVLKETLNGK
jgi:glycosyltransferase involved in cell wall biosynthesis